MTLQAIWQGCPPTMHWSLLDTLGRAALACNSQGVGDKAPDASDDDSLPSPSTDCDVVEPRAGTTWHPTRPAESGWEENARQLTRVETGESALCNGESGPEDWCV
jgi:hypothetical protein